MFCLIFCTSPLVLLRLCALPYGGAWPMSTIIPMMFTTSIKSGCSWNVLPRFPFPQQLLLPQRMHLPNMLTFGKSVAVAVYVSQSKAWHQQMHEAMKRKELRTLKTIANTPLCPLQGFRKDFLSWSRILSLHLFFYPSPLIIFSFLLLTVCYLLLNKIITGFIFFL